MPTMINGGANCPAVLFSENNEYLIENYTKFLRTILGSVMVIPKPLSPRQSLNKAYLKEKILRSEIDLFKDNLHKLFETIDHEEREENAKTILRDFLNDTYYKEKHFINTLRDIDLVINLENNQNKAAVLAEVKRPKNKLEMITKDNLNAKAMYELLLYYLEERIDHKNNDIKFLIATNIYEWFIFDATLFEHLFFKNKSLIKNYEGWRDKQKTSGNTDLFYNEIAKPFLDELKSEIQFTYFDLGEYIKSIKKNDHENEKKLIALYKILSPVHLLKQPFTNDSNSLDRNFYNELLHIIGLLETKEKNKKLINRKPEKERDPGSIIENAILILETENTLAKINNPEKYGETNNDKLYNLALELSITWVNRILFLKLLEAQLYKYHEDDKYKFLNKTIVKDFDELYKLFHQVLAIPTAERTELINKKFKLVPYLNSSLFEISDLEGETIKINSLDDNTPLALYKNTVLKDKFGKKQSDNLPALHYLFEFLDAYDFTSEGKEEIQEDKKTLINASVLGLIFEKINGYKDGSYFTPGFITMYMCRETLRRAVVQKFNDKYDWKCDSLDDIKNNLVQRRNTSDILEFNSVINSIKICDPAVGSGHFLVSALNELIAIKSELCLLADTNGSLLSDYEAKVENDELIITYNNGEDIFEYHPPKDKRSGSTNKLQRVQESLFNEKQTIIENCLFGVDINPNSVKIARLRLWIELLKNAFYTKESNYSELETLPNIDINIKEGNSVISRFDLDTDLKSALKTIRYTIDDYKGFVRDYKNTNNKDEKNNFRRFIEDIKNNFKTEIGKNDPRQKKLSNLAYELHNKFQTERLIDVELSEKDKGKLKKKENKLEAEIKKLSEELEAEKKSVIYKNAFEWRFEFPEVLDDEGKFVGFDVVIGNPPYVFGGNEGISNAEKKLFKEKYVSGQGKINLFTLFIDRAIEIMIQSRFGCLIIPNTFLRVTSYYYTRKYLLDNYSLNQVADFGEKVFDDAITTAIVILFVKEKPSQKYKTEICFSGIKVNDMFQSDFIKRNYVITLGIDDKNEGIFIKMEKESEPLGRIAKELIFGVVITKNQNQVIGGLKNEGWKPFLEGRDIGRYYIRPIEKYLNYAPHLLHRPRTKEIFESPEKLLIQRITGGNNPLKVAYDDQQLYNKESINNLLLKEDCGYEIKYILGLLNTKLINWFYVNRFTNESKLTVNLSKEYLSEIPIKKLDIEKQKNIVDIVNTILTIKAKDYNADTNTLESEIDNLVYQLYGLTEEEIRIVEGN